MKAIAVVGIVVMTMGMAVTLNCYAAMQDMNHVKEVHDGADVNCATCHPGGDMKSLNAYGQAYLDAGRSVEAVTAIDAEDSDGDGVSNAEEIAGGSNPGE